MIRTNQISISLIIIFTDSFVALTIKKQAHININGNIKEIKAEMNDKIKMRANGILLKLRLYSQYARKRPISTPFFVKEHSVLPVNISITENAKV